MEYRHMIRVAILAAAVLWALAPAPVRAADSDNGRLLADRGQVLEGQGAHDAALACLTEAIGLHALPAAEQARLLFARGVIQDQQGRLASALDDYSVAIRLSPGFAPAINNRANVYRRQNRLVDAGRDYLASLTAGNPQPEYPWFGLGEIAEAQGDAAAARLNYARAIAANPAYQPAADRLAALGGHEAVAGKDDVIHLRPPRQAAGSGGDAIVLKPPRTNGKTPAPVRYAEVPHIAPARYTPLPSPDLRPALDNTPLSGPQIQLGAWRTELEAGAGWNKAVRQAGGLLGGLLPHIVAADVPGRGRYYRLRAGPVQGTPSRLCAVLAARGLDCLPARE